MGAAWHRRRLTDAEKQAIVRDRRSGMTQAATARKHRVSTTTVYKLARLSKPEQADA